MQLEIGKRVRAIENCAVNIQWIFQEKPIKR